MYIVFFVLIVISALLLILAVLAQHPKSGMAANFGASNQVMGVRQTSDFLEKFTWGTAIAILVFSLATSMTIDSDTIGGNAPSSAIIENFQQESNVTNANAIEAPLAIDTTAIAE